jgi:hypothetical protein
MARETAFDGARTEPHRRIDAIGSAMVDLDYLESAHSLPEPLKLPA